jgi:hypothetical protein
MCFSTGDINMEAPQIVMIVLLVISGTVTLLNHNKPRPDWNFWHWTISATIWTTVLWWGNFFG